MGGSDSDETTDSPSETETDETETDEDEDEPRPKWGAPKKKSWQPPSRPPSGLVSKPSQPLSFGGFAPKSAFNPGFGSNLGAPAFDRGDGGSFGGGSTGGFGGFGGMRNLPELVAESREALLDTFVQIEGKMHAFRKAMAALEDIQRVDDLGLTIHNSEQEIRQTGHAAIERDERRHMLDAVKTKLLDYNKTIIDAQDHVVYLGLRTAKEQDDAHKLQVMATIVAEKVADEARFLDAAFEEKFAAVEALEANRQIERKYMLQRIELLKKEVESQRRLVLTVAKAQMGDVTAEEVTLRREKEEAEREREQERVAHARLVSMQKRLREAGASYEPPERLFDKRAKVEVPAPPKPSPKLQVKHEKAVSQLFGLSEHVDHELWRSLTDKSWKDKLLSEAQQPYFTYLNTWLKDERKKKEIYPPTEKIFRCLNLTPFDKVKVVIVGQDPYHGPGQADGLCFSVSAGKLPPSLKNIMKEMKRDLKLPTEPKHGDLTSWAEQGVLLLNEALTVEAQKPGSHLKSGWSNFTDAIIKAISERPTPSVFLLWGVKAQKKCSMVNTNKHRVVKCAHPSPLSFGAWNNSQPFSKCNAALNELGLKPIDWTSIEKGP
ncbi:Uracil-DNA glycosylase 2 [Diplonema papillatum]|nr:Uracil-DNA glycosylase 2 [Diplonema papillatum]